MAKHTWAQQLKNALAPALAHEIDAFEAAMQQKRAGKIPDPVFAEMRLRRGVYGQRYDNGRRNDGNQVRTLHFPCGTLTKGPDTLWDAPGMMRIKIPFGGMTCEQMDCLAEVSEEYADSIIHITTRQEVQLHFVHIDDTPDLMRRLGAVGITTQEACGNVVRNVTACPVSGVCCGEAFDVTPYAMATARFFLGHPDAQSFGRKFKVTFSGCGGPSCGLTQIHDIGCVAKVRNVDGKPQRGFAVSVGGGLGAVPYQAQLFDDFVPPDQLLPLCQAISRVFAEHGEKKNRARARMKFMIRKMGLEEFKTKVNHELQRLRRDPRFTEYLSDIHGADAPLLPLDQPEIEGTADQRFAFWHTTNVSPQPQKGYSVVTMGLPLGDLSAHQLRGIADVARQFAGDTVRATAEQNLVMRWVRNCDLLALFNALVHLGLHEPGAGTLMDVTACPGTDTCKLGTAASRGLAAALRKELGQQIQQLDPAARHLRIKISGCFNSCGQHHIADIGFWGVSRKKAGFVVPHFQVMLGGQWEQNGGAYGLAMGAAPSKNIPKVVQRIVETFVAKRHQDETFFAFVGRFGKPSIRALIADLVETPSYDDDPSFYSDWGDPRTFSIGDIGVGECAGEIVATTDFDLLASEREVFEAQDHLDRGDIAGAGSIAFRAMMLAARAVTEAQGGAVGHDPNDILNAFRQRLFDTKMFFDPYAGGKFAHYYFRAHQEAIDQEEPINAEGARKRIEEAQLFVEAAYSCYGRMGQEAAP